MSKISDILLDNVGLTIHITELPTHKIHSYCYDLMYGADYLSRLWCKYIRPIVAPNAHELIKTTYEEAVSLFQIDIINETIKQGKEVIDES